jgi:uncharacterized protein YdeI (YjbR/CyaY-like superfamily)
MTDLRPPLPLVHVATRAEWRRWLQRNHATSTGCWAVTVRKGDLVDGDTYVSPRDLNEECLCFGWIDSRPARVDDRHTALLCTPRTAGSGWSQVNKTRLETLLAQRKVAPAGLAAIERAKADGSWDRLATIDALAVPDDLAAALHAVRDATDFFEAFPPSTRRAILEWIASAKTDATRAKRVLETAELAGQNIRANQWRQPKKG